MRYKKWAFIASVLAVSAAVGVGLWRQSTSLEARQRRAWRQSAEEAPVHLAFQSLEERLPKGRPISRPKDFSLASLEFWNAIDLDTKERRQGRADLLQAFHEKTRTFFVDFDGAFGEGRMPFTIEHVLFGYHVNKTPESQPGPPANFPLSSGEPLNIVPADKDLLNYHRAGAIDFINAGGFGYMTDRRRVSGFLPHSFGYLNSIEEFWGRFQVDHILLVGLLKHDAPVVYLSDSFPSMKTTQRSEVRVLDIFEDAGLRSLSRGDDLYIIQKEDTLRMLGSLRATKQCLTCHDAEPGDLLGAFSYTLRPRKVSEPDDGSPIGPGRPH